MERPCQVLSYRQLITSLAPLLWAHLDLASTWMLEGKSLLAVHNMMRGFTYWLAMSPTLILLCFRVAYFMRKKRSNEVFDLLMSCLLILVAVCIYLSFVTVDFVAFLVIFPNMRIVAGLVFSIPAFSVAVLAWQKLPKLPLLGTPAMPVDRVD